MLLIGRSFPSSVPFLIILCFVCCAAFVLVQSCFLHYIEVSIKGFLGDFLIVNIEFAGCNFGYSTSHRWNGNSYEDNDINRTQVTVSKVSKCFGIKYLAFLLSGNHH